MNATITIPYITMPINIFFADFSVFAMPTRNSQEKLGQVLCDNTPQEVVRGSRPIEVVTPEVVRGCCPAEVVR